MIEAAILMIFPLCLLIAAVSDLRTMTIPNRLPVILLCGFLVLALFSALGLPGIGLHLAAGAIVLAVCFVLFALNVMGGGDAKLLAAAAPWFGLNPSLLLFVIYVAYSGGVLTLLILLLRWRSQTIMAIGLPVPHSILHAKKIPYGIAIAIGGFLAFPSSPLVVAALANLH